MAAPWSLFGEYEDPSIVTDIFTGNLKPGRVNKAYDATIRKLQAARRYDITNSELMRHTEVYRLDLRKEILDKVSKYSKTFRIVVPEKFKRITIPQDKRFMVGLDGKWRGVRVRAPYIDAIFSFDSRGLPRVELRKIKGKGSESKLEEDLKLIESFKV